MTFRNLIQSRLAQALRNEDGATTVDFVVGAAGGVALAIAVMNSVGGAAHDHSELVEDKFISIGIMTY